MRRPGVVCILTLCLLDASCAQAPAAQSREVRLRIVPRNEAAQAPGFAQVMARFAAAVEARDVATVLSMTSDTPQYLFGGEEPGLDAFREHWNMDDPSSEFWRAAEDLLTDGSTVAPTCAEPKDECYVWFPYWWANFPGDLDPIPHRIARGDDVPMYSRPAASAPIVERLSYDVVKVLADPDPSLPDNERWAQVELPDGRAGFVNDRLLHSPAGGYRMQFIRNARDEWRMTVFIAGD
jgi:hypothetical protein